jgi:hypothetical protein
MNILTNPHDMVTLIDFIILTEIIITIVVIINLLYYQLNDMT